jgi:hypothetical protein
MKRIKQIYTDEIIKIRVNLFNLWSNFGFTIRTKPQSARAFGF